jgi:hypothetical protein
MQSNYLPCPNTKFYKSIWLVNPTDADEAIIHSEFNSVPYLVYHSCKFSSYLSHHFYLTKSGKSVNDAYQILAEIYKSDVDFIKCMVKSNPPPPDIGVVTFVTQTDVRNSMHIPISNNKYYMAYTNIDFNRHTRIIFALDTMYKVPDSSYLDNLNHKSYISINGKSKWTISEFIAWCVKHGIDVFNADNKLYCDDDFNILQN